MTFETPAPVEPSEPPVILNRRMRRALASTSPSNPVLKDYALTEAAFRLLCENLTRYGNQLTEAHRAALMTILHRFTMLANGGVIGRYAYALPCGAGKSQSIVAFCATAVKMRRRYSVSVCASKVEALCDLKRDLLANGVPEEEVGLIHSYRHDPELARRFLEEGHAMPEGFASLPCTAENQLRQIVLVTHSRVRGRDKDGRSTVERYNVYRGKRRDLCLWDESLFIADHRSVETLGIAKGLGYLAPELELETVRPGLVTAVEYAKRALSQIEQEREEQRDLKRPARILSLPPLSAEDVASMIAALPNARPVDRDATAPVRDLLEISQSPLRVVDANNGGGSVTYDIAVPRELNRVAILDGSWQIRELERLDKSIQDDPAFRGDIKRYDAVTIHHLHHAAGRRSMSAAFAARKEDREVSREIVEVVKSIPETEGVIVYTFKPRGKLDQAATLRADMEAAGIAIDAKIPVTDINMRTGQKETSLKPRFVFLTFGQETSVSQFKYCSNVVFAGVLHRSTVELAGAMVGQLDNLKAPLPVPDVLAIRTSEVCHVIYQGLNRAACRDTINGFAKSTRCWLMYPDTTIRATLERAMPGLKWEAWEPVHIPAPTGKIADTTARIEEYLKGMPSGSQRISTRKLKGALGLTSIVHQTWTAAVTQVGLHGWTLEGRSFVRRG